MHGVGYLGDTSLARVDRLLWLLVICCSFLASLNVILSSYYAWQDNMVLNTLKTTTKPVTEIEFPAVTICGAGKASVTYSESRQTGNRFIPDLLLSTIVVV